MKAKKNKEMFINQTFDIGRMNPGMDREKTFLTDTNLKTHKQVKQSKKRKVTSP